jgi:hypothetical protein
LKNFHDLCKTAAKDELTQLTSQKKGGFFCDHKGEGVGNNSNHRRFPQLKLHAALGSNVSFVVLLSKRLALKTITPASSGPLFSTKHTKNFCIFMHFFAPLLHIGTQIVNLANPALHHVLALRPSQWLFPISVSFSPSVLNILLQSQKTDLLIHILRSCSRALDSHGQEKTAENGDSEATEFGNSRCCTALEEFCVSEIVHIIFLCLSTSNNFQLH